MRKCHCTSNTKIKGVFRGFFQEGNLEHGCDPVGLIELEDGPISAHCATSIQFDEPPEEVAQNSTSDNKQMDAIALLKEIYHKTECENADSCRYKATFYMKTYDKLEKIAQQYTFVNVRQH